MSSSIAARLLKDSPTVTPNGERLTAMLHGVSIRRLRAIEDRRGDITEMYDQRWNIHSGPLVYAYNVTIRPGEIRGWEMHKKQDDRIFMSTGTMRWVMFDARPESPTFKTVTHYVFSDLNRALVIVPKGVIHAVKNIGADIAAFVNFPTEPYNHDDPDKYRLPIENDIIPFDFNNPDVW